MPFRFLNIDVFFQWLVFNSLTFQKRHLLKFYLIYLPKSVTYLARWYKVGIWEVSRLSHQPYPLPWLLLFRVLHQLSHKRVSDHTDFQLSQPPCCLTVPSFLWYFKSRVDTGIRQTGIPAPVLSLTVCVIQAVDLNFLILSSLSCIRDTVILTWQVFCFCF